MTPLEFAQEFINELLKDKSEELDDGVRVAFNITVLETDPNLNIIRQELNKIGLTITQSSKDSFDWIVKKI